MISRLEKRIVAIILACFIVVAEISCSTFGTRAAERETACSIVQDEVAEYELKEAGETVYYSFIPSEDAIYTITTIGDTDTVGTVYDADWNVLYSDNDSGDGLNYKIHASLSKNVTYYIESGFFMDSEIGTICTSIHAEDALEEEKQDIENPVEEESVSDTATDTDPLVENTENVADENESYQYEIDGDNVRITKYIGSDLDVEIPEQIDGKYVTRIGEKAFEDSDITSVSIPSMVTEIEYGTFSGCSSLKNVTFSNEGNLKTIGEFAFFYSGVENLVLPDGLTTINKRAFSGSSLITLNMPDSVTNMGVHVFSNCVQLENVRLSESLTTIPNSTFYRAIALKTITLPANTEVIGAGAFRNSGLESITIPSKVKTIEDGAFDYTQLSSIVIPDSVTYLGNYAFSDCEKLATIKLGKGIKTINENTFYGTLAQNVDLGNVEVISKRAFMLSGMETLNLPVSVTEIQYVAFYGSSNLTSINASSSLKKLDGCAFEKTKWYKQQPDGLLYVGNVLYNYKGTAGKSVTVKDGTKAIASVAFFNQKNIESVILPNSLEYINVFAFLNCASLKRIEIPDSVTEIEPYSLGYIQGNAENGVAVELEGYNFNNLIKQTDFTIVAYPGTEAERYAKENGFKFEEKQPPQVTYRTHVQSFGWQDYVTNGMVSGTSGLSKRLEAIEISLSGNNNLGIQYTTHCQSYGWLPWSANGEMNGTEGEAKRLEAIKIQLTGADKNRYDVYYRVHAQSYGWLGWAKNGEPSGTSGLAKRLEAIQIVIVKKGESINTNLGNIKSTRSEAYVAIAGTSPVVGTNVTSATNPVIPGTAITNVAYKTHVQSYGWQGWKYNGQMSGTSGQAKRLEGINIKLTNQQYSGSIVYTTHVQSYGWQGDVNNSSTWKKDGEMSGTSGKAKRLEAICIKLTGEMEKHYDVYYRVHAQSYGWLGWTCNGAPSGTAGYGKRLEGIQIVLVPKGSGAPASNYGGLNSNRTESYIAK